MGTSEVSAHGVPRRGDPRQEAFPCVRGASPGSAAKRHLREGHAGIYESTSSEGEQVVVEPPTRRGSSEHLSESSGTPRTFFASSTAYASSRLRRDMRAAARRKVRPRRGGRRTRTGRRTRSSSSLPGRRLDLRYRDRGPRSALHTLIQHGPGDPRTLVPSRGPPSEEAAWRSRRLCGPTSVVADELRADSGRRSASASVPARKETRPTWPLRPRGRATQLGRAAR